MTDTYCIDYNNYLADDNDDDENDDDGNDDVKQRRWGWCHVFLQRLKTSIKNLSNLDDIQIQLF